MLLLLYYTRHRLPFKNRLIGRRDQLMNAAFAPILAKKPVTMAKGMVRVSPMILVTWFSKTKPPLVTLIHVGYSYSIESKECIRLAITLTG